jgi:hypothetical protein
MELSPGRSVGHHSPNFKLRAEQSEAALTCRIADVLVNRVFMHRLACSSSPQDATVALAALDQTITSLTQVARAGS